MRSLFFAIVCLAIISCNNKSAGKPANDSTGTRTNKDSMTLAAADSAFGYIKSIEQFHDSIYINFDKVEYFHGPDVVEQAKKRHMAETAYDKNGKVQDIFVADDYFIMNDDTIPHRMVLAKDVTFDLLDGNMEKGHNEVNNFQYLQNHFQVFLFRLSIKNNLVSKVEAVYLP